MLFFAPKINALLFFREFHRSNPSLSFKVVPFPEAIYFNPPPCHNFLFPPLYDFFGAHVVTRTLSDGKPTVWHIFANITNPPSKKDNLSVIFLHSLRLRYRKVSSSCVGKRENSPSSKKYKDKTLRHLPALLFQYKNISVHASSFLKHISWNKSHVIETLAY